ncbi:SdrD B-like domain-containing protein [Runella sp.]|uniref:SdrD B-like domain-containing protein n=1 Tax=Runella sp. TaxID=1960881 RepID=UPI003D1355DA
MKPLLLRVFSRYLVYLFFSGISGIITANAQISGTVFYDFDANGTQTFTAPGEAGVSKVGVRIFVAGTTQPIITQTDTLGHYSFSAQQVPTGSLARLEFFNLPETFFVSLVGPQNGTEIRFIQAPAANIDLGILNDDEFCRVGSEVKIVTACYAMGDPLKNGSAGDDPALVVFDYTAHGLAGVQDSSMIKLAKASEIGATWIAAYQRATNLLLVGAITRRHVGLGPLGTGGYYSINLKTKAVSNFLDVKTIGIDTGPDPHIDPITHLNILPADKLARNRDSLSFHVAGKVGLGGSQLSTNQDTLFMVNLYDRKLYSFLVGKPMIAPANIQEAHTHSFTIPHPGCSNNEFVPWGLKYYRGKLYLGVVCTAETSQKKDDLKAAVYEFNPKTATYKNIFEFGLNYPRGPIDNTQGCDSITSWMPWTNVFPKQCNFPNGASDPIAAFAVYPQAILSDLEFDDDGSLLLAFMDRLGLQTGQDQPGIAVNDTLDYYGFMSGDLVRAQRNADGTFTLESNAKSGDLQGCGINTNSGPGGGEFFCEDYWLNGNGNVGHAEITNGGLFKISGVEEVLISAMDPLHATYLATGFVAFDTKTGTRKRGFAVYAINPGSLGKSGGVGDLAGICEPAPLEIGNILWYDTDNDGIQEANEGLLDNIIITLHDMQNGGTEVARDTTANGGQYYFNDNNVPGGLKRNHSYEVRIDLDQEISTSILLKNFTTQTIKLKETLQVSPKQVTGDTQNFLRDSNAEYNSDSTQVIIKVTTGENAQNNHTLDFGLSLGNQEIDLELSKRVLGDCIHQVGDTLTFQLIVHNASLLGAADSVMVADTLHSNFTLLSAIASQGNYNSLTHQWGPLAIGPGLSDTLNLTVVINKNNGFENGILLNEAQIIKASGNDIDSEPGNSVKSEDDYDIASISVPIPICVARKDTVIISAPAGYATYQWFKNGVKLDGATSQTLSVDAAGNYTVEIAQGQCPTNTCCPLVIIEDCQCPKGICIPVVLQKIKTSNKPIPLSGHP